MVLLLGHAYVVLTLLLWNALAPCCQGSFSVLDCSSTLVLLTPYNKGLSPLLVVAFYQERCLCAGGILFAPASLANKPGL